MTATNGLFVQSTGPGTGTTARQARAAVAGLFATGGAGAMAVRTGVVWSGVQTLLTPLASTAPMMVRVAPLHYLSSRSGGLDGAVLGSNDADGDVSLPAAPALGTKRIDVIYIQQQDANASVSPDASTQSLIGVLQGAASSSPVKPTTLPAGAVEVGTVTYDATSVVPTKATDAQVTVATTCQWTATRGAPVPVRSKAERDALPKQIGVQVLRLDKRGLVQTWNDAVWRGQRRYGATKTLTTDASGFITVTHDAAFTPSAVTVTPVSPISGGATGSIFGFALCDTFTASTFRLRALFANGAQISSASVSFSYECIEAEEW